MKLTAPLLLLLAIAFPASASASDGCAGAAAMDKACASERHLASVFPDTRQGLGDLWATVYHPATVCQEGLQDFSGLEGCRVGLEPGLASQEVALIGDSHSAHWRPGIDLLAKKRGWTVISLYVSACDYTTSSRYDGNNRPLCSKMRESIPGWLSSHPQIGTVIFSQVSRPGAKEREGYRKAWALLPNTVKRVIVIRDNPHAGGPEVLKCIRSAQRRDALPGLRCAQRRNRVLVDDAAYQLASNPPSDGRQYYAVDLTDRFCSRSRCFPTLGGLLVYGWLQHQAPSFNRSLAPYLDARLPQGL